MDICFESENYTDNTKFDMNDFEENQIKSEIDLNNCKCQFYIYNGENKDKCNASIIGDDTEEYDEKNSLYLLSNDFIISTFDFYEKNNNYNVELNENDYEFVSKKNHHSHEKELGTKRKIIINKNILKNNLIKKLTKEEKEKLFCRNYQNQNYNVMNIKRKRNDF